MQVQTSVLDAFQVEVLTALQPYTDDVRFRAGDCVYSEGDPSDAFYIIKEGDVRLQIHSLEVDTEPVLDYMSAGSFVGNDSVLAGLARWTSAYAETDVTASKVSSKGMRRMFDDDPEQGIAVLRALGRDTALRFRSVSQRLGEYLVSDIPDPAVDRIVGAAVAAQKSFAAWPEDRVDALLKDVAESIAIRAEELAQATVNETTIGVVEDKVMKIRFASLGVLGSIAGNRASGPLRTSEERRVTELASPVGVVFGLVPVTNPVSTFVNKALICLKSRNAVILSPHRMSQGVAEAAGVIVHGALERHGAPIELVQWVRGRTSRQRTQRFMHHPGVAMILATGGPGMVKAAYSSGKPAIGVGAGNAPAWIAADANLDRAARAVLNSKTFDNGLICGAEQHLVVDDSIYDEFVAALESESAFLLDARATAQFVERCLDLATGHLHLKFVGRSAEAIAEGAGLEVPAGTRLLVFSAADLQREEVFGRERLAPVLSIFKVNDDDEAIALCKRLLSYEGAGHTAVIHSDDQRRSERFASEIPASRVLVNAPAAFGCCGIATGLTPSLTLGCGTWGGNSTTDNVSFENLLNLKRLAEALM
ncbi:MAG: aldehyde dehydrogenase family protein [Solirubrobacteraceae bacterium]